MKSRSVKSSQAVKLEARYELLANSERRVQLLLDRVKQLRERATHLIELGRDTQLIARRISKGELLLRQHVELRDRVAQQLDLHSDREQ